MMTKLNQIGDTIIEVMIAVAVIGMTIGGAYGIANRSLRSARSAQERGEALKLAEGQLERIRAVANDPDKLSDDIFGTSVPAEFCFIDNTADGEAVWQLNRTDEEGLINGDDCTDGLYHTSISRAGLNNGVSQFTVLVRWYQLGSDNIDQVKIDYRVMEGEEE